jgi:hypothetical protein
MHARNDRGEAATVTPLVHLFLPNGDGRPHSAALSGTQWARSSH